MQELASRGMSSEDMDALLRRLIAADIRHQQDMMVLRQERVATEAVREEEEARYERELERLRSERAIARVAAAERLAVLQAELRAASAGSARKEREHHAAVASLLGIRSSGSSQEHMPVANLVEGAGGDDATQLSVQLTRMLLEDSAQAVTSESSCDE